MIYRYIGQEDLCPSAVMRRILQQAISDFFNRNDNNNIQGDSLLPYEVAHPNCDDFLSFHDIILKPLGVEICDGYWPLLEYQRSRVFQSRGDERTKAMDHFNHDFKQLLVLIRNAAPDACQERGRVKDFWGLAYEMASLMTLSDDDITNILAYDSDISWDTRSLHLIERIKEAQVDVLAVEELDMVENFTKHLSPRLKLAAFKYRAIQKVDDGVGLFYNPSKFRIARIGGKLAIGAVRFSGSLECKAKTKLKIRPRDVRYVNGVIDGEADEAGEGRGGEMVTCWCFTDDFDGLENFDDRTAIMVVLEGIASGVKIIFVATHLTTGQGDARCENIRVQQILQLECALKEFRRSFQLMDTPMFLVGDCNDTPKMNGNGCNGTVENAAYSKFYTTALTNGWKDLMGERCPVTSLTLSRSVRIDYIFGRVTSDDIEIEAVPDEVQRVHLVGYDESSKHKVLLPYNERKGALYGPPLPAVDAQPAIPSDHVPIFANITLKTKP